MMNTSTNQNRKLPTLLLSAACSMCSIFVTTPVAAMPVMASDFWNHYSNSLNWADQVNDAKMPTALRWLKANAQGIGAELKKGESYFQYVYGQVVQKQMPAEIAVVPIVESGYNPNAHSNVGAVGIWQLMSRTASALNVHSNGKQEGRSNLVASTKAALSHLQYLHDRFGDWALALAAYNCGAIPVKNAIQYNQAHHLPTDFWSLKQLPKQTRNYVPRILAVAKGILHPSQYHLQLPTGQMPTMSTLQPVIAKSMLQSATYVVGGLAAGSSVAATRAFAKRVAVASTSAVKAVASASVVKKTPAVSAVSSSVKKMPAVEHRTTFSSMAPSLVSRVQFLPGATAIHKHETLQKLCKRLESEHTAAV